MSDPAIIEAAARALEDWSPSYHQAMAKAVLAAVTPLIKREAMKEEIPDFLANVASQVERDALERAAQLTEKYRAGAYEARQRIAAAIRALKEQP